MVLMLGLTFGLPKFVDLNNVTIVQVVQAIYAVVAAVLFYVNSTLTDAVTKGHAASPGAVDMVVYTKEADKNPLMAMFSGEAAPPAGTRAALPKYTKTTLAALELKMAETKASAAMMAIAQPLVFSMLMKIHIMVAIRVSSQASLPRLPH